MTDRVPLDNPYYLSEDITSEDTCIHSIDGVASIEEVQDTTTDTVSALNSVSIEAEDVQSPQAGCARLPSDLEGDLNQDRSSNRSIGPRDNVNANTSRGPLSDPTEPKGQGPRVKAWMLRIANPTDQQLEVLRTWNDTCEELVACRETSPDTKLDHLHVYVMFTTKKRMTAVKKLIGNVHCEPVKMGYRSEAINYCHKHDSVILYDKYQQRTQQGHIVLDTLAMMREGTSERDIITAQPSLAYRPGTVAYLKRLASEEIALERFKQGFKPEVYWFFGETGTGKSRSACEMDAPEKICVIGRARKNGTPWFNAYDPLVHDTIVFDDFRWDWFEFDELLRLLDYTRKHMVEIKGSSVYWIPRRIIITTCKNVEDTFTSRAGYVEEHIDQLVRRVDEVREYIAFGQDYIVHKKLAR